MIGSMVVFGSDEVLCSCRLMIYHWNLCMQIRLIVRLESVRVCGVRMQI